MIYILFTWLLAPIWWPLVQVRKLSNPAPRRILIAEIAGIGDVVCSTAVFKAVRAHYPDAHIALMVDTVLPGLAAQIHAIDQVVPFAYGAQRGLRGRLHLMRLMRGFDTVICLIPSAAQLTAACWAAVPRRYSVLPDITVRSYRVLSPLMTHTCAHQSGTNFVGTQLRLLEPLGVKGDPINRELAVSENAREKAHAFLPTNITRWIGLAIGSGQGLKTIQPEVLRDLIAGLLSNPESGVVLIGGSKEQALAAELVRDIGLNARCMNAVGEFPLEMLPGLLERLAVFIGVDSGVTYMVDTLGIPLVYLPGPASPADQGPIRTPKITLEKPLACAPCSRVFVTPRRCMTHDHACISSFTATDILHAVNALLKEAA